MSTRVEIVTMFGPAHLTGPRVAVLAYDGLCTFEFSVANEVFALTRPEAGPSWYRHAVCRAEPGPLRAVGGLVVSAEGGLDLLDEADLVVVRRQAFWDSWRRERRTALAHLD